MNVSSDCTKLLVDCESVDNHTIILVEVVEIIPELVGVIPNLAEVLTNMVNVILELEGNLL